MPLFLLDIATAQLCSCFCNSVLARGCQVHFSSKLPTGNAGRLASCFSWKPFRMPQKARKDISSGGIDVFCGGLKIKAVATLETTTVSGENQYKNGVRVNEDTRSSNSPIVELHSSSADLTGVDEREKLRRMRISKANKGNRPWNKGRKHSPETLQRIREKTRLAMQDPKVKLKLANLGHAQSQETRMRIGVSVRLGWERRRKKLMQQEICYYEWKNLIAEASRRGLLGEEMLLWDSYEILSRQLEQEWLHSIEERKKTPQPKGNKRAPKPAEQRRKISEAISAKWADPEYRSRVCSGLYKFHGVKDGAERKPKRKPSGDMQTRKISPPKTKDNGIDNLSSREPKHQTQGIRLKKTNKPLYKDPLASSKLEMLKNIRAQRAAAENQSNETVARAKFLIAEAEKAAKALEKAAKNVPLAQSSLLETRMLIAEAIQYVESIENGDLASHETSSNSLRTSTPSEEDTETRGVNDIEKRNTNGVESLASTSYVGEGFDFEKLVLPDFLNGSAGYSNNNLARSNEEEVQ